jgi:hypothetical protein
MKTSVDAGNGRVLEASVEQLADGWSASAMVPGGAAARAITGSGKSYEAALENLRHNIMESRRAAERAKEALARGSLIAPT